ncbi:hypothetical protein Pst134EA_015713 [Puccinia striiformis f. sp. tritici]|uniref:hypothetical protein n=1 Tax=Puccinia striiformis f. sp. tritici TaxID=168172 RepID=UPI0020082B5A|nr:hypothetical protein Pst134EA_015713 [Puccinia striiformis f. sp. tritici]KAH9463628.1 hypothetical protein Pst134EA_015713 [Puccinia striiformis f. sp. tritici]
MVWTTPLSKDPSRQESVKPANMNQKNAEYHLILVHDQIQSQPNHLLVSLASPRGTHLSPQASHLDFYQDELAVYKAPSSSPMLYPSEHISTHLHSHPPLTGFFLPTFRFTFRHFL